MQFYFFFYSAIFLFGLAVGSFLNCIIYRLETDQSFLKGRSYCPKCKKTLTWRDLIPLVSFLALKGKCRYCSQKISWQYPLVELATAIIFLSIFNIQYSIFNLFIACFLIIIFFYDLKHFIIPDKIVYPAIFTTFFYRSFEILKFSNWEFGISNPLINGFSAAAFGSCFFLTIVLLSRGKWMGSGDVKLAFLMGLFLGFPDILLALFLAFLIGAIIGLGLIIAGKKTLKSEVPFAPFLVTGTFLTMFLGEGLINWYFNLLIV